MMIMLSLKKGNRMKDKIREKFGSISKLAAELGVSRASIYLALKGDPHMKKLLKKIKEMLSK